MVAKLFADWNVVLTLPSLTSAMSPSKQTAWPKETKLATKATAVRIVGNIIVFYNAVSISQAGRSLYHIAPNSLCNIDANNLLLDLAAAQHPPPRRRQGDFPFYKPKFFAYLGPHEPLICDEDLMVLLPPDVFLQLHLRAIKTSTRNSSWSKFPIMHDLPPAQPHMSPLTA